MHFVLDRAVGASGVLSYTVRPICPRALDPFLQRSYKTQRGRIRRYRFLGSVTCRFQANDDEGSRAGAIERRARVNFVQTSSSDVLKAMDGNEATATVAYALSDVSFIYPITPATPMGEQVDVWAAEGRKNLHGNVMQVIEMESEMGVAGALHGALSAGALATTFTCSQGLLLMIPNMYKIAGELLPCVLHVTARTIATHAASMFGDHQDVMAVRQTGWAMLSSHSVQEAADLALVAHLATLKASVPFVHFFDGFRTSHEMNKIHQLDQESYRPLVKELAPHIQAHRARALNPEHPHQQGTAQGPDIFFQAMEAANKYYQAVPDIVEATMSKVGTLTGRHYHLFDYYGHPEADRVVVAMGSGCSVLQEAVDYLNQQGQRVGLIKVHLFRPWSSRHLLAALPDRVQRLAVLDRTKEPGSEGEPLFQDVAASLIRSGMSAHRSIRVVGGRYGLSSKEFTPAMAVAVYNNLASEEPKDKFTVGINDDVSHTSLPVEGEISTIPPGTFQSVFWGMGSDGTVGANKEAIKIIAEATDMYAQGYSSYDAKKSGGLTVSHLRFGPQPITSSYLVEQADYVAVHHPSYLTRYDDVLNRLKPGGTLVVNSTWSTLEELQQALPFHVKQQLGRKHPRLFLVDAQAVAEGVGLGKRINMVMQTVFFYLSGVLPMGLANALLKVSIRKAYGRMGEEVVAKNCAAVDGAIEHLHQLEVPVAWTQGSGYDRHHPEDPISGSNKAKVSEDFLNKVVRPMLALKGDSLPVSAFTAGGSMPPGTSKIEKRQIATSVPLWFPDLCSQCNCCSFVCPHAAIRPVLATQEELQGAPAAFSTVGLHGKHSGGAYHFRVQVSPADCTGCQLCVDACPEKALAPAPADLVMAEEGSNWQFLQQLPGHPELFEKTTVRGSQFQPPLLEFSGACEGCGETPYIKLLTQLFGGRMIIANATGCSIVWGAYAPSNPYTTTRDGRGPAWANSLFEDNAQFGFGITMAVKQRRAALARQVAGLVDQGLGSEELRGALKEWLAVKDNGGLCGTAARRVVELLQEEACMVPELSAVMSQKDLLDKPSVWIVGGDGWAYDIGFGGLDHVLSTGEDVNVLVLDNEMYSNTGGQKSKSTPLGAVAKFAVSGNPRPKKDLCQMVMQAYPDVYVASVCLDANYGQVVKAMLEAEAHPGASLVVGYAPCAQHGIDKGMSGALQQSKLAVDSGYWPLYRYSPPGGGTGMRGRLHLDSKKLKGSLDTFLSHEDRFSALSRSRPEVAEARNQELSHAIQDRHQRLQRMASEGRQQSAESSV